MNHDHFFTGGNQSESSKKSSGGGPGSNPFVPLQVAKRAAHSSQSSGSGGGLSKEPSEARSFHSSEKEMEVSGFLLIYVCQCPFRMIS